MKIMRYIIIVFLFCYLPNYLFAQEFFTRLPISDTTNIIAIASDSKNQALVAMASGKVFHSTGNGALSQIYFDSTSTIMGIFADNKDNIYIVSQGSLAMSFDDGQTWRVLNELINLMVVQPSGTIYRTEQYLEYWGLFRSHDTAQTWQQVARGVYPQSLIVGNDGTVFLGAGYFWFPGSPSPAIFIEGGLFSFPEDDTTTTSTGSNTAMISNLTPAPFDGVFLTSTYASSSPKTATYCK
jgi:hypothetical protein